MAKANCWEVKKCGRQPGGNLVHELGICPACTDTEAHGLNDGLAGGRLCWAIAGTFCGGSVQGSFAQKELTCISCDFFRQVEKGEGAHFTLLKAGQSFKRRV